jgi:hypothetical protein
VTTSAVVHVAVGVPVDPDRETAHRWMVEELSRPEYATEPSLLERLVTWFLGLFDGMPAFVGPPWQVAAILVGATVVIVLIAWRVTGPVRLARRATRASAVVLGDDTRTAAELRAAADAAAGRGDWSTAVVERFRAVVRGLEERVVLDELPGRTAQEAADAAAQRLPATADALRRAARLFDDVCYGTLPASPDDDAFLRALDQHAGSVRPLPVPGADNDSGSRPGGAP